MGQPAPAPQQEPTTTPADTEAVITVSTGDLVDGAAEAQVKVLDSDSLVEADVGVLGGADGSGLLGCACDEPSDAGTSAAIAVHADVPSDLGGISLSSFSLDSLDVGSLPVADLPVGIPDLPTGDAPLLGDLPDLCSVLGDIA